MCAVASVPLLSGALLRNERYFSGEPLVLVALALSMVASASLVILAVGNLRKPGRLFENLGTVGVVATWFAASCLAAVVGQGFNRVATYPSGEGLSARLLIVCVYFPIIFGLATTVIALVDRRQNDLWRTRRALEHTQTAREQARTLAVQQQEALAAAIESVVMRELDGLARLAATLTDESAQRALEDLQVQVSEFSEIVIRSASHEVSTSPLPRTPEFVDGGGGQGIDIRALFDLFCSSRITATMGIPAIAVLAMFQTTLGCLGRSGLVFGTFAVVLLLGLAAGKFPYFSSVRRRLALTLLTYAALILAFKWSSTTELLTCEWQGPIGRFGVGLGVVLLVGLSMAQEANRRAMLSGQALRVSIDAAERQTSEFERATVRTRDQVALVLHGSVQGRLAAASLALRAHLDAVSAGGKPDQTLLLMRVTGLLERARNDVNEIFADSSAPPDLGRALGAIRSQWSGLLRISWSMPDDVGLWLTSRPDVVESVVEVVQEAVTNASRHGRATEISLTFTMPDPIGSAICVEAIDNGTGPAPLGNAGLGSSRIRESGGEWTLMANSRGGSILVVRLPVGADLAH